MYAAGQVFSRETPYREQAGRKLCAYANDENALNPVRILRIVIRTAGEVPAAVCSFMKSQTNIKLSTFLIHRRIVSDLYPRRITSHTVARLR